MDNSKLYAKYSDDLDGLFKSVKRFSDDIGVQFGLATWSNVSFNKSFLVKSKISLLI